MRGKEAQSRDWKLEIGITPAHAGKSKSCSMLVQAMRDHPRTCGEKDEIEDISQALKGSPPHMRGKGVDMRTSAFRLRITPAHAGKRCRLKACLLRTRDHPRTCGEKSLSGFPVRLLQGSPPHMRGKVFVPYV